MVDYSADLSVEKMAVKMVGRKVGLSVVRKVEM